MGEFKVVLKSINQDVVASLHGALDENAVFPDIENKDGERIVFDFDNVTHINSLGIHSWIDWNNQLAKNFPEKKLVFSKCPKIIVDQMNSIQDFYPANAELESLYVPFYCDETGNEKNVLFHFGQEVKIVDGKVKLELPEVLDGDHRMDIDIIVSKYFKFLERAA